MDAFIDNLVEHPKKTYNGFKIVCDEETYTKEIINSIVNVLRKSHQNF